MKLIDFRLLKQPYSFDAHRVPLKRSITPDTARKLARLCEPGLESAVIETALLMLFAILGGKQGDVQQAARGLTIALSGKGPVQRAENADLLAGRLIALADAIGRVDP